MFHLRNCRDHQRGTPFPNCAQHLLRKVETCCRHCGRARKLRGLSELRCFCANFEKKLERYFKKVVRKEVYEAKVKTRLPLYLSFPALTVLVLFERDSNFWQKSFFRVQDRLAQRLCRLTIEDSD